MESTLQSLRVPLEYAKLMNESVLIRLETWKQSTLSHLLKIQELAAQEELNASQNALIVASVAPFERGPWTSQDTRVLATSILQPYTLKPEIIQEVLKNHVKPLFRSNPHPSLHLETARKLARLAGGMLAGQDIYEGQAWKGNPGAGNMVLWCVQNMKSEAYENLWHLVVPPMMILLDDFEGLYKVEGIRVVRALLASVPSQVLKRTGVDALITKSLGSSLAHLNRPETPELIREAIPAALTLIDMVTVPGSSERFERLSTLVGDNIIGGIWLYSNESLETMVSSVEMIPLIVQVLGVGTVRFLKALIPQLVQPLVLPRASKPSAELQGKSCTALVAVIDACPTRVGHWKGTILDGVGRCWVNLHDDGGRVDGPLGRELKEVFARLVKVCPSILENEYPRMLDLDRTIFSTLNV